MNTFVCIKIRDKPTKTRALSTGCSRTSTRTVPNTLMENQWPLEKKVYI